MATPRANELLGYPADARLLIINADDFGMYHANTAGILDTVLAGVVRSTTLMVPCPWVLYAMDRLREHPEIAFGVHLTIVTDFDNFRWGPLSPKSRVPSLLDSTGFFHRNTPEQGYLSGLVLDEVEIEFRAQIEAVLAAGLQPTHLDYHCLRDGGRPDIFAMTIDLAREYGLAIRTFELNETLQDQGLPTNDHLMIDSTRVDTDRKTELLLQMLRALPAGLTEWALHPALDTVEGQAIDGWLNRRVSDHVFAMSDAARETVREEGIILLDYRALQAVWRNA